MTTTKQASATKAKQQTEPVATKDMNLWQRINAVRAEVGSVAHDKQVGEGSYAYDVTTHQAILKRLRPLMAKHGLVDYISLGTIELVDTGMRRGKQQRILFQHRAWYDYVVVNADDPSERHTFPVIGYADDSEDKGPGKVNTYALKYGQKILFQIGTSDDEEEARISQDQLAVATVGPEQLEELLLFADECYGDDAGEKIAGMCNKVLHIEKIADLPAAHFDATMKILRKQAIRDGKIETTENDDANNSD